KNFQSSGPVTEPQRSILEKQRDAPGNFRLQELVGIRINGIGVIQGNGRSKLMGQPAFPAARKNKTQGIAQAMPRNPGKGISRKIQLVDPVIQKAEAAPGPTARPAYLKRSRNVCGSGQPDLRE